MRRASLTSVSGKTGKKGRCVKSSIGEFASGCRNMLFGVKAPTACASDAEPVVEANGNTGQHLMAGKSGNYRVPPVAGSVRCARSSAQAPGLHSREGAKELSLRAGSIYLHQR